MLGIGQCSYYSHVQHMINKIIEYCREWLFFLSHSDSASDSALLPSSAAKQPVALGETSLGNCPQFRLLHFGEFIRNFYALDFDEAHQDFAAPLVLLAPRSRCLVSRCQGGSFVTRLLLCEAEGHDQHHHSSVATAPRKSTVGRSLVHCALRVWSKCD